MRKIILPLIILLFATATQAQYVTIPDTLFRNFLMLKYPACFNASKQMDTTCSSILNEKSLSINNNVKDISGIVYFKGLQHLSCAYNTNITGLPKLPDSLTHLNMQSCYALATINSFPKLLSYINVSGGALLSLPTLPNSLDTLFCAGHKFTSLPALPNTLRYLECSSNYLTVLPTLPNSLTHLACSGKFTTLPTLPSSLVNLICGSNNLTYYYNINNPNYYATNYGNNNLTTLPSLPSSLKYLVCVGGKFTSLPALPNSLKMLYCTAPITSLPTLPNTLDTLICISPSLSSLPTLPNSLKLLDCSFSNLTKLPSLPNSLKTLVCTDMSFLATATNLPDSLGYFDCRNCGFTSLPPIPTSISAFNCSNNSLTSLSMVSTGLLGGLYCNANKLTSLPILDSNLNTLNCADNLLTSLPALPKKLVSLTCGYNKLTSIPTLPNVIDVLDCPFNKLTSLPTLPFLLAYLRCGNNLIDSLPTLSGNLRVLSCGNNKLKKLPFLPRALINIYCEGNDIYCLPRLPKILTTLSIDSAKVLCIPNTTNGLKIYTSEPVLYTVRQLNVPLCNAVTNINNCPLLFPIIEGNVFFDQNANNKKDTNEVYRAKTRINLSNNTYTFTNDSGYYEIAPDTIGVFSIKQDSVNFSTVTPASKLYNFSTYDTIVKQNFAIQPIVLKDSLRIGLTNYWWARPGFNIGYFVNFENAGTTSFGATTVTLNYDNTLLTFDSATIKSGIVTNNGSSLIINLNNLPYGAAKNFSAWFRVKTTVAIGTQLCTNASIVSGSTIAIDTNCITVRGSFDPNDKAATPTLSTTQVIAGKKIDYTIRYQNTGTDTAFNVVITDTLDSKLNYNSLQIVATSHLCKATIKGNVVLFEMKNILLPDSHVNKIGSNGFIRFTMLPKNTVVAGDNIPNQASIYFDYNAPVITNTAITQIKNPVLPLRIISYELRVMNEMRNGINEKQITSKWVTTNEINTSHFVIQRSEDGRVFKSVGTVEAKGNGTYQFKDPFTTSHSPFTIYYRLQIVDKDGVYTFSDIKQIRLNQLTNKQINIYPNPASAIVSIDCHQAKQIWVIDYLGRTIKQFNNPSPLQTLNSKQLLKGIYVVKVLMNDGEIKTEKLIIE